MLDFVLNRKSAFNKWIVALYGASILVANQLGYPDVAEKITTVGLALATVLVGNAKDVVVVSPPAPPA